MTASLALGKSIVASAVDKQDRLLAVFKVIFQSVFKLLAEIRGFR